MEINGRHARIKVQNPCIAKWTITKKKTIDKDEPRF
jgi:hypothetical protein